MLTKYESILEMKQDMQGKAGGLQILILPENAEYALVPRAGAFSYAAAQPTVSTERAAFGEQIPHYAYHLRHGAILLSG